MCEITEKWLQEGREAGRTEGIEVFILDNLEKDIPKKRILEKLQRRFKLKEETTREYFDKYALAEG